MAIETQEEWNARLAQCGCCPMPVCGTLSLVTQYARYIAVTAGFTDGSPSDPVFDIATWMRYLIKTRTRTGEYAEVSEYDGFSPPYHYTEDRTSEYNWVQTQTCNSVRQETGICATGTINITSISLSTACSGDGFYTFIFTVENAAETEVLAQSELFLTAVISDPTATGSTCRYDITRTENSFDDTTDPPTPPSSTTTNYVDPNPVLFGGGYDSTTDDTVYTSGTNWADWVTAARSAGGSYLSGVEDSCWIASGSTRPSKMDLDVPISKSDGGELLLERVRYRFRIPNTHLGSYYKVTWDIVEIPDDGDPSFVSEDNVYEWEGPGSGASTDPSWLSPWYFLEPPTVPGTRKIVNIRYTCYLGTQFGVRPQVIGEAYPAE